jgi:hypothetical protein
MKKQRLQGERRLRRRLELVDARFREQVTTEQLAAMDEFGRLTENLTKGESKFLLAFLLSDDELIEPSDREGYEYVYKLSADLKPLQAPLREVGEIIASAMQAYRGPLGKSEPPAANRDAATSHDAAE